MKRLLASIIVLWIGWCAEMSRGADTYCNPLDVIIADPFVLKAGKEYFLYGTTNSRIGFEVYRSFNLVDWTYGGWILQKSPSSWGTNRFWAPECFEHHGKYYLHYTAGSAKASLRIGLAVADTPAGPFKELKSPWIDPGQAVIDSDVFRDTDGKLYVYYVIDCSENKFSEIHVAPVSDDLTVDLSKSAFCARPSQDWEGTVWNEGPEVLKHNGVYYMMYSANGFMDPWYSVGYATASSPMGPWKKYESNPILVKTERVAGPGHNCVTLSPDGREMLTLYHTLQNPGFNAARQLAMDRIRFAPDPKRGPDLLKIEGPTAKPQPLPSGAARLIRGQSDEFDGSDLDRRRWTIFRENPRTWSFQKGRLSIQAENGDVADRRDDLRNLFLQYAPTGDFDVMTRLTLPATTNYQNAFLMLWQDHDHFIKVASVYSDSLKLEVGMESGANYESKLFDNPFGQTLYLKAARRGDRYSFSASGDGRRWTVLVKEFRMELNDLRVGIGAARPAAHEPVTAYFDFVRFAPK